LSIFLILLFIALITPTSHARESIVDYYNLIPIELLDNQRYQLQFINNEWRSEAYREIKTIVDIKNGYLKIMDTGTDGRNLEHELALYRTNEGTDIIGVNITRFDGPTKVGKLKFYKPINNLWIDVTYDVLPKIDESLFINENYKLDMKKVGKFILRIEFLYKLPRIGTTMSAKINVDRFIINSLEFKERKEILPPAAKEIINNIKYQEIKLIWDKNNCKFTFGEKSLFTPSEMVKNYLNPAARKPPAKLKLDEVRRIIREKGAREAASRGLDHVWGQLLDAIATGEPAWLEIACELGRHSDGEASETLDAAMGEALRRAPRAVLQRLDGNPFHLERVCGNTFADTGIRDATDEAARIAEQEAAVAKVRDKSLTERRDTCLELIRRHTGGH